MEAEAALLFTRFMALVIYGVVVLTLMMLMYALERRSHWFVLAFAVGCLLSSSYGFLSGAWPFGCVELIWSVIAVIRFRGLVRTARRASSRTARPAG